MSELTIQALMNSQVLTMSSREIAELTGKQHKNVKRAIEVMLNDLQEDALRFEHIYMDSMNRLQTEYLLDRDHTECLLTGYSAIHRMRVIRRWHELESVNTATMVQTLTDKVQAGIAMLTFYKQELRIAPSAMLGAMKKLQSSLGMPDILPAYAVDAPDGSTTGSSEVTRIRSLSFCCCMASPIPHSLVSSVCNCWASLSASRGPALNIPTESRRSGRSQRKACSLARTSPTQPIRAIRSPISTIHNSRTCSPS
ncbi:MAG: Rha family transcriptional regulator [Sodalis sp. (in: enterobacteria)]|uniref:Rha family transcriptional regulator n=1 Tax=Sodalis sp. (in: enterobacteria) TaxID=1898979 RepID=UPI0039E5C16A